MALSPREMFLNDAARERSEPRCDKCCKPTSNMPDDRDEIVCDDCQTSPHGSTGASHPAIKRALQVYGKDWGEHSEGEQAFLKALRAADVKCNAACEEATKRVRFATPLWNALALKAMEQRDADYASALLTFEAFELEEV